MRLEGKKNLLTIVVFIVLFLLGGLLIGGTTQEVKILTDKNEYQRGENLRLQVRNFSPATLCFSSCYPYYLEWKRDSGKWEIYSYESCQKEDLVEKCIDSWGTKIFEMSVPQIRKGTHRLSVPVCQKCLPGQKFREDKRFYSNEFEVK